VALRDARAARRWNHPIVRSAAAQAQANVAALASHKHHIRLAPQVQSAGALTPGPKLGEILAQELEPIGELVAAEPASARVKVPA